MKRIVASILSFLMLFLFVGCAKGVSQAEYDALKSELDHLKENSSEISSADISTPEPEKKPAPAGKFDEEAVLSKLEVTKYSYSTKYWHYAFLVIKNNSEFDLNISAEMKFYNDGNLVGASSTSQEAVEAGTETILWTMPDEAFTDIEYTLEAKEESIYECVISDLSYETTSAKKKEIVSVTNNGTEAAEFVEGYVLFFEGDTLVDFDDAYFTDDDSEIKPGKTITKELECSKNYDSIKIYFTGRRY